MARSYRGVGTIRWGAQDGKDGVNYLIMGWWSESVHYKLTDAGIPVVKVEDDLSNDGFSVYKLIALQSTLGTFIVSEWEKVKSADFVYMQDAYIERLQAVLITAERIEALDIVHPSGLYSLLGGKLKVQDAEIEGTINAKNGTIEKLTMAENGVIELPPMFTSSIKGAITSEGISLVYQGVNSQKIEWYTGLGTFSGLIAPNSQGHLSISSSFGLGIQSKLINIGTEALAGNINIGSVLAEIDFNGSSINNIKEMTNIGYTSMASLTFTVANNESIILRHDTPLSILTSVGSNSFLKSIYMNNNSLLREGTIKWILNRSTSGISIATDGNIRINSGDLQTLQAYSLTPFIYSAGYWYKHSDHR